MTQKIYKSAMGRTVDLGALLLQNEQVRAVGNMGVNAAGDLIDSTNRVIDQRNRQVHKQYKKQTNVSDLTPATSNLSARKAQSKAPEPLDAQPTEIDDTELFGNTEVAEPSTQVVSGGLAAAIARSREVKQELEKTLKQRAQEANPGVRKL